MYEDGLYVAIDLRFFGRQGGMLILPLPIGARPFQWRTTLLTYNHAAITCFGDHLLAGHNETMIKDGPEKKRRRRKKKMKKKKKNKKKKKKKKKNKNKKKKKKDKKGN
jgi:hypothetical protein